MKAGPRVEIAIDELVLHGFSASDRDAIGESLGRELGRLVEAGDHSALAGLGDAPVLRSPNVSLQPGARPVTVGAQVARSVHASLSGPSGGGSQ